MSCSIGVHYELFCREKELEVLVIGASCLQLFVQNNWVGPHTDSPPALFCPDDFTDNDVGGAIFTKYSTFLI